MFPAGLQFHISKTPGHLTQFLLGGGGGIHPPSGFCSITQKREKLFSSNLATFFIDKWATICIIKLEDRPFHVAMVMAQIKRAQI